MKIQRIQKLWLSSLLVVVFVSACGGGATSSTPVLSATHTPNLPAITIENTHIPTETPLPVATILSELVLWAPVGSDATLAGQLAQALSSYAATAGLGFEQVPEITSQDLAESVRVVVSLAPAEAVNALSTQEPAVQFLAVGVSGITALGNLSVLSNTGASVEDRAFLAGYLLTLTIPDYRVGVISQAGTEAGIKNEGSFIVGARFFCGLCNSRFGPVLYYPIAAQITDPTSQVNWQAAADTLLANSVQGVYLQPEVSSAELVAYLEAAGVKLVGVSGQAGLDDSAAWIGVIGADIAGETVNLVERLLAGEPVGAVELGLNLSHINADILTEGKQRLFEETVKNLQEGLIQVTPYQ